MQIVKTAWSALMSSVDLGGSATACSPYCIYYEETTLLDVMMSYSDGTSPVAQRTSLDGVRHAVRAEAQVDTAAWECSAAMDHAMRMPASRILAVCMLCLATTASTRSTTTGFFRETPWNRFNLPLRLFSPFLLCCATRLSSSCGSRRQLGSA